MDALSAKARITGSRRLVVKVGSALLVEPQTGALRAAWLAGLAEDISVQREIEEQLNQSP